MMFRVLCSTSILLFSVAALAEAAFFELKPAIGISVEYDDNVLLEKTGEKEDYITVLLPSLELQYSTHALELDAKYMLDYRHYNKGALGDETVNDLSARLHMAVLRDFFSIDLSDELRRVSLYPLRDFTRESSFLEQSDRNVFRANPYFTLRPVARATLRAGYVYSDTRYSDTQYSERAAIDRTEGTVYADLAYDLSPKVMLSAGYGYTRQDSEERDFRKSDFHLGSRCEYAEDSSVFVTAGSVRLDFSDGGGYSEIFWRAGLTHGFGVFTGSVESALDYAEDPLGDPLRVGSHRASLKAAFKRTSFGVSLSVSEYEDAATGERQGRRYGAEGDIGYELTGRLKGAVDLAFDRFDYELDGQGERRLAGLRFDYRLSGTTVMTLSYRYAEVVAPPDVADSHSYMGNRFSLGLRQGF